MKPYVLAALLFSCLSLTACETPQPITSYGSNNFICDSARQMVLAIGPDGENATVTYEGRNISMLRVVNDTKGMSFSNGIHTLYYNKGKAALIEETTPVLTGCIREE